MIQDSSGAALVQSDDLRIGRLSFVGAAILLVLVAFPRVAGQYQTVLLTYGLTLAIAALGFNLLLGYTGLLSFGHSAYLGTGAYAVALLVRNDGAASMELGIVAAVGAAFLISAVFGLACVRHTRIFFSILTLALSQVLWSFASKFYLVTGGTDGIRASYSQLTLLGGLVGFHGHAAFMRFVYWYYYYVLVLFVTSTIVMWMIVRSPFGITLQAIRDNETRAKFVGIAVERYRWLAFVVSGVFTGLAGALLVPLNEHITPDILYWSTSGEIVFLAVLGGFRSFIGPVVGAIVFNYLRTYAVALTEYWQLVLGGLLILLVLLLPAGIVGTAEGLFQRFRSGGAP